MRAQRAPAYRRTKEKLLGQEHGLPSIFLRQKLKHVQQLLGTKNLQTVENSFLQTTFNEWEAHKGAEKKNGHWRRKLVVFLLFLREHRISLRDVFSKDVFSSQPFQKASSKDFFRWVQNGNCAEVRQLLMQDRYLVYDVDNVTCLQKGSF